MSDDPDDSSLKPTLKYEQQYDEIAIKRARELLTATPENVGPYRILERIGGGGMGDVYRAEQRSPIRRQVAIKFIKLGMDSKAVIIRFEAERQALALMDHPHIAKVFDAGTDDSGRPYFVMEYVKGKPITDYADQNHLTIAERLKLFEQVCQAVQHAHHKGVIHRDLKPGNVLVSTQDGEPFAKVIDFGVAKAISQKLTDGTLFTQHDQFIGTPQYMSPEQAEGSVDIDTRTDVYSLGVLLYELLTGSTPFSKNELKAAAFEQIKKMIIEDDPPKPSTRLGPNTPTLSSLATFRRTEPKRLGTLVQGELDWIVMKSIDKDRRRRYETPTSLANDILAHLNGEPVQAAPPSTVYRIRKFVGKNSGLVVGVASVMTALLIGVFGTTWGLFRAWVAEERMADALQLVTDERDEKEKQRQIAETAKKAEAKQRREAEQNLITGVLRPIGFNSGPLPPAERRSLIDWSTFGNSQLKLVTLEVAFQDPTTALQLARRAERVLQSCVGPSPIRRTVATEFLSRKQRDTNSAPQTRVAACWLALELGSVDVPALEESFVFLSRQPYVRDADFRNFLEIAISRTDSQVQNLVNRIGGDVVISLLQTSKDNLFSQRRACEGLIALAPRLEPDQVARAGEAVIEIMPNAGSTFITINNEEVYARWDEALFALAPRLERTMVMRGEEAVIAVFEKSDPQYGEETLQWGLKILFELSPWLEPEHAKRALDAVIAIAFRCPNFGPKKAVEAAIEALASRLEPDMVTRESDAMILLLETSTDYTTFIGAAKCVATLANRLDKQQVASAAGAFNAIIKSDAENWKRYSACEGLKGLAPYLSEEQTIHAWETVLEHLQNILPDKAGSGEYSVVLDAFAGLEALALRIDIERAIPTWETFISTKREYLGGEYLQLAGHVIAALAPRLTPEQCMNSWNAIFLADISFDVNCAEETLEALNPLLSQDQVIPAWNRLLAAIANNDGNTHLSTKGEYGLVLLARRLPAHLVEHEWSSLLKVLKGSKWSRMDEVRILALSEMASRMVPTQIKESWDSLIDLVQPSTSHNEFIAACQGMISLVPRMQGNQVKRSWDALEAYLKTDILNESNRQFSEEGVLIAYRALAALAPQLQQEFLVPAGDSLLALLKLAPYRNFDAIIDVLFALTNGRDATELRNVVADVLAIGLDITASNETVSNPSVRGIQINESDLTWVSEPRTLAKLFSHAGCIGEFRQSMLRRFEELVLHDGQSVFSRDENQDGEPPARGSMPQRQFHNLQDAAAWIQKNWPDFDLETNHPVTWRGEHK